MGNTADYEVLMTEIKTLTERVANQDQQILAQGRQILAQDRQILAQDQRIDELTHLLRLLRAEITDEIGENGDDEVSGENGAQT